MTALKTARISGLYAITPDTFDTQLLVAQVEAALAGGARVIQYRNKTADQRVRRAQARMIRDSCLASGAFFIVNDDVDLAREVGADGIHVGAADAAISEARLRLGPTRAIGVSCYNDLQRARAALEQGADYIALGSFFPSPSKPQAVRAQPTLLARAKAETSLPVVAIGGITLDNAQLLIENGADAVAVISALFGAPDIKTAAQKFSRLFATDRS